MPLDKADAKQLYRIFDKEFEKKYKCKLANLYDNPKASKLLAGQKIFVSRNVQGITPQIMEVLIKSAGGEVIADKTQATLVLMDEHKDKKAIQEWNKNTPVCGIEFIFDGIL